MRYLALTISINGKVPDYTKGLMRKIVDFFVNKGYYIHLIEDKSTKPRGFYVFGTDQEKLPALDEFIKSLDGFKDNGVKYELIPLNDASEAGLILRDGENGRSIFEKYYGAYPKYMFKEK